MVALTFNGRQVDRSRPIDAAEQVEYWKSVVAYHAERLREAEFFVAAWSAVSSNTQQQKGN